MKKINKHFYLQEQTINEIKEYAEKNNTTSPEVIEMLWEIFKQSYSDNEEMLRDTTFKEAYRDKEKMLRWLICEIKGSIMIPYYEELKFSIQRVERDMEWLNLMMKQLLSMTAEKNNTFGWLQRKKKKKAAAKEVLQIEEALKKK